MAKRTKGHRYYECARNQSAATLPACRAGYIPADELERLITSRLLEYLTGDEYLQAIVDALRAELARRPVEPSVLDDLRAKLAAAESAAQRIADALERAPASETLLKRLTDLEKQVREYRAELAQIEADERKRAQVAAGVDVSSAQRNALDARTKLESPDFRSRQLALRGLIRSIRVGKRRARPIMGEMTILLPDTDIETTISLD